MKTEWTDKYLIHCIMLILAKKWWIGYQNITSCNIWQSFELDLKRKIYIWNWKCLHAKRLD